MDKPNIKKMGDAEIALLAKVLVWGETRSGNDANFISKSAIEKRLIEFFHRYVVVTRDEQVILRQALDCAIRERIRAEESRRHNHATRLEERICESESEENADLLESFQAMRLRLRWDEASEIVQQVNRTESECAKALGNGERS